MKLIRFGAVGHEKPGVQLDNGTRIDVSNFAEDYTERFFETNGIERLQAWLEIHQNSCDVIAEDVRLGSPICRPSKLLCIGLNYAKHAAEAGMKLPKEPVLFFKSTTAIVGPNDDVVIPKESEKTDWEVELAVVIGKKMSYVPKGEVMNHIAGYVLHNDISERAFQLEREGQWCKGKGCDTFAPLGPFVATKDEIKDPNNLHLWLKLNGETMQDSSTSDFIFNIQEALSYISEFMTLLPGDVISTGTPFGVGMGLSPQRFLKPGDVMELGIEGLGVSKQQVKAYPGK
ncbi:fumarylacetoacetate hydrolase family protein [Flavobacteriaceae bacterium XHP0103]|uniref:fumarylacetoacetate hydrolase family protein n=1 Tax=Marixanthotalea marina TaxID=2844359 RepID=UPI002989E620|nr:fumarylacetoacetate hydrolase family protein [Marixanthotalea marina]MBU3821018.1 fumarylacetoacetate hydrolase family protein [Marixanthotalea marina]